MSLTTANGLTFHTQILGARGSPVVMIHGLLGSLVTWYFTAAPPVARTHRVFMYDLRGHGKTERTSSGYDLKTMSDDLAGLLDGFDPGPASIVGHSYGGVIALRYALDHPERVNRLGLVDVPMPPSNMEEITALRERKPEQLLGTLPIRIQQAIVRGERGRKADRTMHMLKSLILDSSLMNDLQAEPDFPDDVLARLNCPVRCIYGDRSSCMEAGRRLSKAFAKGELVVLSGGHYLPVESSAVLTASLLEFLNG